MGKRMNDTTVKTTVSTTVSTTVKTRVKTRVNPTLNTEINAALNTDLNAAFPVLVTELGPRLYSTLRRISGDHHTAQDLTQETLIRAHRALQSYPPARILELRIEPWIFTIALNLGRNHLRDQSRRPTPHPPVDRPIQDPEPPDSQAWDRRLSQISKPQRTAVLLRHVAGLSIDEISEITGRAEGTVKADIHRGLEKLRTIISEEKENL